MILNLKYLFIAVFFIFLFESCSKEYSNESGIFNSGGNSSGTSIFNLQGAPGNCIDAIVNGTYTTGVPLGDSNAVDVSVNVDSAGSYAITTGTINGISFNASGTFSAKGVQTVTLQGSGTPVTAGNIVFTPGKNGCSFPLFVIGANTTGGDTTSYLTCGISGINTAFDSALSATSLSLSGLASINIKGSDSISGATFMITLNSRNSITTGAYNILTITNPSATFCAISYIDNSLTQWATAVSSQSGTFQVIVASITSTQITGTFSGTLYDNNGTGSNSKIITIGKFSAQLH